jgi:PAS domain S-box-containing protein
METIPRITNSEQARETVRGHRRRFDDQININSILDSLTNAIILTDQNGVISFVNQQTIVLFGYQQDELIGRKIEILLPDRFRHRHVDHRKKYYSNPGTRQMGNGLDLVACRKDGTEFPCEIGLSLLNTADGIFIVSGLHDISKRKLAEDALLENERLLHKQYAELELLYRTAPLGLCHMDTNLRFLRCNEKLAKINGIAAADHIGRTLREIVPDIAETMESVYRNVIESGQPEIDVIASMEADTDPHKLRHFSACYYPVKSEGGVVQGVSSIVQEITERVEAEQSLRDAHEQLEWRVQKRTGELKDANIKLQRNHDALIKSEHRLRQLVESTNAIPWEADAKTWQFIYVGPQAVRLLGYPVRQWYEPDFWADHLHPEDREYAIKYCLDSSHRFDDYEFDYRMIMANGDVVWLHDIVKVVKKNGEIDTLRGYMINVTERRKMEEEMRKAVDEASVHRERLAHLIRVKTLGEMASGIAHEINQPLAAIESYAQASRNHLQSGMAKAEKIGELLDKISGQARRGGAVIGRLRALMQRRTFNTSPININNLLIEVSKIAEIDTQLHECELELKLDPSFPIVIVDEIQIQQVVLNLIRNAIDAMIDMDCCENKTITISTNRNQKNEVVTSISDCGSGIAESDAGKIFEAFYTTKDSGLGMGLAICRNIINAHSGEINYSQSEAGGTTFHFSLPVETQ